MEGTNQPPHRCYLAYGSNLWISQMRHRCPSSPFICVAVLDGWKWIISERGYANIVESPGDVVYGFVYLLTKGDEEKLDRYEGPSYDKFELDVQIGPAKPNQNGGGRQVKCLTYIDVVKKPGAPKEEYIHRMTLAVIDALAKGVPHEYITKEILPLTGARMVSPDEA